MKKFRLEIKKITLVNPILRINFLNVYIYDINILIKCEVYIFCQNCGKEIDDNANFCQYCGFGKKENRNLKFYICIFLICCFFIAIISILLVKQSKTATININTNGSRIEDIFNPYQKFIGSKVLVKVSLDRLFSEPNKQVMQAAQYKIEHALYINNHGDAVVEQVSKNEFLLEIPNEFDKKEIERILNLKPSLEFKTRTNDGKWVSSGITSKDLKEVAWGTGYNNEYLVAIKFNNSGKKKFTNLTSNIIEQQLGIFINNELISAPKINEPIKDGIAQISGGNSGFNQEEVAVFVNEINADILPLKIEIIEIR